MCRKTLKLHDKFELYTRNVKEPFSLSPPRMDQCQLINAQVLPNLGRKPAGRLCMCDIVLIFGRKRRRFIRPLEQPNRVGSLSLLLITLDGLPGGGEFFPECFSEKKNIQNTLALCQLHYCAIQNIAQWYK